MSKILECSAELGPTVEDEANGLVDDALKQFVPVVITFAGPSTFDDFDGLRMTRRTWREYSQIIDIALSKLRARGFRKIDLLTLRSEDFQAWLDKKALNNTLETRRQYVRELQLERHRARGLVEIGE